MSQQINCPSHTKERTLGTCMAEECSQKGPFCYDCIRQHLNHFNDLNKLKEYQEILRQLKKEFINRKKEISINFHNFLATIEQFIIIDLDISEKVQTFENLKTTTTLFDQAISLIQQFKLFQDNIFRKLGEKLQEQENKQNDDKQQNACPFHPQEKVIGVCIDENCQRKGAHCYDCLEVHEGHNRNLKKLKNYKITLRQTTEQFENLKKEFSTNVQYYQDTVQSIDLNFSEKIQNLEDLNKSSYLHSSANLFVEELEKYYDQIEKFLKSFTQSIEKKTFLVTSIPPNQINDKEDQNKSHIQNSKMMKSEFISCHIHNQERVIGICLVPQCRQQGPFCFDCLKDHLNHFDDSKKLKDYIKDLENIREQFNHRKSKIINQFLSLKNIIQSIDLDIQVNPLVDLNNTIELYNSANLFIEELKVYQARITKYLQSFKESIQQQRCLKIDDFYDQVEQNDRKQGNAVQQQNQKNIPLNDNGQEQQAIRETQINPAQQQKNFRNLNLKFSRELKGEVKLEGDDLIAHGNQFALCNQTTTNEGIQFAFSLIQGDFVFVGACHKDIIYRNNFQVSLQKDQFNHGAYLISSYGYAWSHNQQKYNGGKLSFKYDSNDIVIVQIDNKVNRIRWIVVNKNDKKEKGQKQQVEQTQERKFSMRIDPNLDLTPCVFLLYDSSVEIVNDFEKYL